MPDRNDGGSSQEKRDRHTGDRPEGPSPGAHRRRRVRYGFAGAIVTLTVVTVVVGLALTSGRSSQAKPLSAKTSALGRSIEALLAGIPQGGNALGSPSAPVTLQFFGDLECPTSRAFTLELLPPVISKWVRGGELRVEYHSLRTATPNPEVFSAQQAAALAAGMQDKLWYYVENFYHQQGREDSGYVTDRYLQGLAEQTPGLNVKQWGRDRNEPPLAAEVAIDEQTAVGRGLYSTPSLLIGRTRGGQAEKQPRLYPVEPLALDSAIERLLGQKVHSPRVRSSKLRSSGPLEVAYRTGGLSDGRERTPC